MNCIDSKPTNSTSERKLVSAEKLLEVTFEENSRPSLRWLRTMQKNRVIPSVKLGHLVFFDPDHVRAALEKRMVGGRGKAKGSA